MKTNATHVQLVITSALIDELPASFIKKNNFPIIKASKIKSLKTSAGIVFVITGVGPKNSKTAAEQIAKHIGPLFVVNIGSCGSINKSIKPHKWISISKVFNTTGQEIKLDQRLPFTFPGEIAPLRPAQIITLNKPLFEPPPNTFPVCDLVDMECFEQANVFEKTSTTFHSLKFISDSADKNAISSFKESLPIIRKNLTKILSFLNPPKKPDISVIIPVFKRANIINKCIDSVLAQTLPPREIIVVDDGSNNNELTEKLKSYKNKIKLITLEENHGVSFARNTGVKYATGDWLCFLDSDDTWSNDKLKNQWEYHLSHPFYQILQSEDVWIRDGKRINACKHHKKPLGWSGWPASLDLCLISPSGVMINNKFLHYFNDFDETLKACEDYDLWIKITRHHPVGLEPGMCIIKYGGHEDQLSKKYPIMDDLRVKSLFGAFLRETEPNFKLDISKTLIKKLNILIKGCKKRNKFNDIKKYEDMLAEISKTL